MVTLEGVVNGSEYAVEVSDPPESFYKFVRDFNFNDANVDVILNRFDISADAKAFLSSFMKTTIKVGHTVVKIGRKILDIILSLMKQFPSISFGIMFGLLVGALIAAIPVLGALLGPLALTIAPLIGAVLGGLEEYKSGDIGERVKEFVSQFQPLVA